MLDIETAPMLTATFTLYPENIGHQNIIQDWFVLCWSWKELGSKVTKAQSVLDFKRKSLDDDYGLMKAIREELDDVDVIVGQNARKFDMRKINARLIFHKLKPLPYIEVVDTLLEIRKIAQMSSNRLDYLGKHLVGHGKLKTSDGLWLRCLKGDKKAFAEMVKYCKLDVIRLEEVYMVLRPYMKAHSPVGIMMGHGRCSCNKCGSTKFTTGGNKTRYTASGNLRIQRQCASCFSYQTYPLEKAKHGQ